MKILIIGNGAKELAALKVLDEKGHHEAHVVPVSTASASFEKSLGTDALQAQTYDQIPQAAEEFQPDLVLILDEQHCRYPIRDILEEKGFKVFAPNAQAADLLYNKDKWIDLFKQKHLSVPESRVFEDYDSIYNEIQKSEGPWVLTRMTNPAAFTICYTQDEAMDVLDEWFSMGQEKVMVSDYIDGIRFNIPAMVSGNLVIPMGSTIIQRGMYEQEDDAQLKGLGAIAPADIVDPKIIERATEEILIPFARAIQDEGVNYTGFMSGEFVVSDGRPVCVNVKCGLPDCGSILSFLRFKKDAAQTILDLMEGTDTEPDFVNKTAAVVVLSAKDYPEGISENAEITLDEDMEGFIFPHHAKVEDNILKTDGGRVLFVAVLGKNRADAARKAQEACSHIHCDDLFYRTDIGAYTSD